MGFLSRFRRGTSYGPFSDDVPERQTADLVGEAAGTHGEGFAGSAPVVTPRSHVVGVTGQYNQAQRTTSAERAFMELRRGSND